MNEAVGAPSPCSTNSVGTSSQVQFEGESSLSAHTAFASRLIERAVSTAPLETFSSEMATTLVALRRLAKTQDHNDSKSTGCQTDYRHARPDPSPVLSLHENPMPPIESVMGVLQLMKSKSRSPHRLRRLSMWLLTHCSKPAVRQRRVPHVHDGRGLYRLHPKGLLPRRRL
jgi:hypothetical protein